MSFSTILGEPTEETLSKPTVETVTESNSRASDWEIYGVSDGNGNLHLTEEVDQTTSQMRHLSCDSRFEDEELGHSFRRYGGKKFDKSVPKVPYVPIERSVDLIYEEDLKNAGGYFHSDDFDDDIVVIDTGNSNPIKFDDWKECEFSPRLYDNILKSGYTKPRKIQAFTMPYICQLQDIVAQSETSSGKSAAFILPIIDYILKENPERKLRAPLAIIISPTRELALQTHEQARKFCCAIPVTCAKAYGQYSMSENLKELENGCDILSTTPGRLKHFCESGELNLEDVKFLVLDEADELHANSFSTVIKQALEAGNCPDKEKRTTLLFSATFPLEIQSFTEALLKPNHVTVLNKNCNTVNKRVIHNFVEMKQSGKSQALVNLILECRKESNGVQEVPRTLVFVGTKRLADTLAIYLVDKKINSVSLNGDRPQKLREEALNDFRAHRVDVVVATDVCARGLDIKDLDHVIQYDLPSDFTTFIHRSGRTGRNKIGTCTTYYNNEKDEAMKEQLVAMLTQLGQEIPQFF
uniref:RNA helicase n=1 Tax=Rhabditophanes sp. KR3021 TaxID=114890 RepID=A0AC35TIP9_9BILA